MTDVDSPLDTAGLAAERVDRRDHLIGACATLAVVAVWLGLAVWRPDTTFHLAPVLAGAAWPIALRRGGPLRVAPVDAARGAIAGAGIALVAALVLWWAGLLEGPTWWDDGSAIVETVPAIAIGAVGGYRSSRCGPSF